MTKFKYLAKFTTTQMFTLYIFAILGFTCTTSKRFRWKQYGFRRFWFGFRSVHWDLRRSQYRFRWSQWAVDFMESKERTLGERLVAFVIVEGIFFQGAFAVIFWFKKMYPGKLPGVVYSNELIAADEAMHTDHGVLVYRSLPEKERLSQVEVNKIFQSAMDVERFFTKEFLEEGVLGLSQQNMIGFLEYMCDYWLNELGYAKLFGTPNPLTYMDMLSLKSRTNFFERRNREYRRGKSVDAAIQTKSFQGAGLDF